MASITYRLGENDYILIKVTDVEDVLTTEQMSLFLSRYMSLNIDENNRNITIKFTDYDEDTNPEDEVVTHNFYDFLETIKEVEFIFEYYIQNTLNEKVKVFVYSSVYIYENLIEEITEGNFEITSVFHYDDKDVKKPYKNNLKKGVLPLSFGE